MMFGKNDKRSSVPGRRDEVRTIGSNISFAAKEAYKLLRTNLSYILSEKDAEDCHVIGVTSSLRGEGKSTTAVNLAYVLAEMNRKVLLLEGDMRIPSLHKKLKLQQKPGLSNALVNKSLPASSLQRFTDKTGTGFDVLTAGDIPPNPSELLASKRMQNLVDRLKEQYDYIVVDLPPVTAVTDSLVASKLVEGVIVVVRSDYSDRNSLNETLRQISLVNSRLLGFVLTCYNGSTAGYGRRYRYYRRYRKYGYEYGYEYRNKK